jgi:tetratricopeptide (TPR) repeat protein
MMRLFEKIFMAWLIAVLLGSGLAAQWVATADQPTIAQENTNALDKQVQEFEEHQRQITLLIEQLGDKDFFVRERAQAELAKFGLEAFDALSAATLQDDLEVVARAKYLLLAMRVVWAEKNDPPEVKRLLADYESKDAATKLGRMSALSDLPGSAGIPALCRLVRFERSSVLSKHAAIAVIDRPAADEPPTKELVEVVRKNLVHGSRASVQWLGAWLRFADDPRQALDEWTRLIAAEQSLLKTAPKETSPEIISAMIHFQIVWLKQLGRIDEATAVLRRLVESEKGNPESLAELLDWLLEQKAWKLLDEMVQQYQPQIKENALLLYIIAQAHAEQGDKDRAEKTAAEALNLNPGKDVFQLNLHRDPIAQQLRQRGLFTWAEREFRHAIDNAPDSPEGRDLKITAKFGLAEMLRDQESYQEAAKQLQDVLEAAKQLRRGDSLTTRRSLSEIQSQINYMLACHYERLKDSAKQREYLALALEGELPYLDAIIVAYHLPGQSPEQRQKVLEIIRRVAADTEDDIRNDPNNSNHYNQYAWLVGNTEGDLNLAIKYSKRSIELSPNSGGLYDTLAHVYFTMGDYENAVKYQTKAAKLEPHARQILEPLQLFRARLEEQKKERAKDQMQPMP